MGANEKHAATYHGGEYTPTTDDLREIWVDRQLDHLPSEEGIRRVPETQAAFDRWLETVRAEAKAEALNEAAHAIASAEINLDVFEGQEYLKELWAHSNQTRVGIVTSLRARANQYKENQS